MSGRALCWQNENGRPCFPHAWTLASSSAPYAVLWLSLEVHQTPKRSPRSPEVFTLSVTKQIQLFVCFRTTVPVAFCIACFYLTPLVTSGPNAKVLFDKFYNEVETHWWQLLLQVRNFVKASDLVRIVLLMQ